VEFTIFALEKIDHNEINALNHAYITGEMRDRKMKSEQQEVYEFLVFVISRFGTGGHPEPSVANLHLFTEKYVGGCIKRAIASGKLADKYVKMGREYLALTNQTRLGKGQK
jgi:hypothetical protein